MDSLFSRWATIKYGVDLSGLELIGPLKFWDGFIGLLNFALDLLGT